MASRKTAKRPLEVSPVKRNILVTDGDAHWFVIPEDKEDKWWEWVDAINDDECIERPDWADPVGGAPSRVRFGDYEIL